MNPTPAYYDRTFSYPDDLSLSWLSSLTNSTSLKWFGTLRQILQAHEEEYHKTSASFNLIKENWKKLKDIYQES